MGSRRPEAAHRRHRLRHVPGRARDPLLSDEDLAPARASGALLQDVIPEVIERGEVSMVYSGGAFSHAVLKRATDGEFRVQQDFGGRVERTLPSTTLLDLPIASWHWCRRPASMRASTLVESEPRPVADGARTH